MKQKVIFKEKQKFTQWWLYLLLCLPLLIVVLNFDFNQITELPSETGNSSFSIILPNGFWIIFLEVALLFLFFRYGGLTTIIDKEKIEIKHLVFYKRTIYWEDIESVDMITYGFVGYGIRWTTSYGTAYNVKGNQGIALILKNGSKCLIGTQKQEEFYKIAQQQIQL